MKLGHGDDSGKKQMDSIVGLLFFGVPNRGMNIESLQPIVSDGKNRYLLESVGQYSDLLMQQDGKFGSTFRFKDSRVVSFFETKSSSTAIKVSYLSLTNNPQLLKILGKQFMKDEGSSRQSPSASILSDSPSLMGERRRALPSKSQRSR